MNWKSLTPLLIIFLGALALHRPVLSNVANLDYLGSSFHPSEPFLHNPEIESCQQIWFRTVSSTKQSTFEMSESDFDTILTCGSKYVSLLKNVTPVNIDYAIQAVNLYPENSESWFWLGEASAPVDFVIAQEAYLQTVTLYPKDPLAWCRLGSAYDTNGKTQDALNAFLTCCNINDAGSNGCYGAGRMAEKLGDPIKAIEYYRLSHWDGALNRADELESQLQP